MEPKILLWAKQILALSQTGLTYAEDPYDRERYTELRELAANMMAESTEVESETLLKLFEKESGYATPKVDVRGAVFKDGKILLSRELDDGCWSLPGGWADVNDSPSQALAREMREEAGVEVRCTKLVAVLDRHLHPHSPPTPYHIYKLFFICDVIGEGMELCHDISETAYFAQNALPPLSLHRTLPAQIGLMFLHHENPKLPTKFD